MTSRASVETTVLFLGGFGPGNLDGVAVHLCRHGYFLAEQGHRFGLGIRRDLIEESVFMRPPSRGYA